VNAADSYQLIESPQQLQRLGEALRDVQRLAIDTEFVSEYSYRAQLCLLQLAWPTAQQRGVHLAVIDAHSAGDLTPLWHLLAEAGRETVVHSGREEMLFCHRAIGRWPARVFDVQIAAGLVGYEYPASYASLVSKVLGVAASKGETRTDWRRRPLSPHQLAYALDDVRYLLPLSDKLRNRLKRLGRLAWLEEETGHWLAQLEVNLPRHRWRNVPRIGSLSRRELGVLQALWHWRDELAMRRNTPPQKVLRDDLVVELARRATSDPHRIQAVRGLERRDFRPLIPQLARCIEQALQIPEEDLPRVARKHRESPQRTLLGQFLTASLASICRRHHLAPSIVGTASDVRELIAYRLGEYRADEEPPALARGWRATIIGSVLDDLIAGRLVVRVADPRADDPLVFESNARHPETGAEA
jgi:ribonuclease D